MTTRLRSKEAREPVRATQRAPHAHKMHRLRGRRTRQSDSPTGLPGGPEELIYQHLTLTPTGGNGGPGAPCPSVPATSAAPPPVDPLGVGAPHPRPLRCLLQKHNLLTEGGHGPPPSPGREIAGGERSHPISTKRSRRSRAHAGQNSNVCCAESTLV